MQSGVFLAKMRDHVRYGHPKLGLVKKVAMFLLFGVIL